MEKEGGFSNIEKRSEYIKPEITVGSFDDVKSSMVWYSVLKKIKNRWGEEQDKNISEKIEKDDHEITDDVILEFNNIWELADHNDETLRWLAFAVDKDETIKSVIIDSIVSNKGMDKEQVLTLFEVFENFYKKIKDNINVQELMAPYIIDDIKGREEDLPELNKKIDEAIEFFRPVDFEISKVVYLPSNPLEKKQSGNGVVVNDTTYLNTEKGNRINQVHEFLHCIINPIIDKLTLNSDEERKILAFCSDNLKKQEYVSASSILTEEIIRTYKTGFNPSDRIGFDGFMDRLLSADDLDEVIDFKKEGLESKNVDEFLKNKNDIRKYYDKYIKNILSERIWDFFREYSDQNIYNNFEEYFLNNYKRILAD